MLDEVGVWMIVMVNADYHPQNVQYFLLAFFWWSSKPVTSTWWSVSFSHFHIDVYTFHSCFVAIYGLLFIPCPHLCSHDYNASISCAESSCKRWRTSPTQSAGQKTTSLGERCILIFYDHFFQTINLWHLLKANYDIAMLAVAYIELLIFVRVLFGAMLLQNSLLSPIVYSHFLRQRYYQSTFTRQAVTVASRTLDRYASRPGNPPLVGQVWRQAKALIEKWAGSTLEPQPQPATVPRR